MILQIHLWYNLIHKISLFLKVLQKSWQCGFYQVNLDLDNFFINDLYLITWSFFQTEFCEVKKKYDAAKERLENDVKEITELVQVNLGTFCVDIFILKHLIWIFNVGTFKLENQCFIPQLKLSEQGMTIKNIKRN